jgi:hypothetical protein
VSARPNIYAQGLAQMMSNFWFKNQRAVSLGPTKSC